MDINFDVNRKKPESICREPLHSFPNKDTVNGRALFPRVYASLTSFPRGKEKSCERNLNQFVLSHYIHFQTKTL